MRDGVGIRAVLDYEEFIAAKKHLVLRLLSHRASEQRDELAALHHSITSSARSRIAVGISTPMALAVLRFTTISNFVGCSIGKSAG